MKIIATIEARMTSHRLPGKVMLDVLGKPVMQLLVERLRKVELIGEIVLATTVNKDDDCLEKLSRELGIKCYRGSEEDVLQRLYEAASAHKADTVVEITGDCPLIDPDIIRACIKLFRGGDCDYVSNGFRKKTFPDGLATQVFTMKALEEAHASGKDRVYREHPSYYIYTHTEKYRCRNYPAEGELHWPELSITLDTPQDYKLIKIIFEELYPKNRNFSALDIVRFLRRNPDLAKINEDTQRRDNYLKNCPRTAKGTNVK